LRESAKTHSLFKRPKRQWSSADEPQVLACRRRQWALALSRKGDGEGLRKAAGSGNFKALLAVQY
jgi:hypothetical protein